MPTVFFSRTESNQHHFYRLIMVSLLILVDACMGARKFS